MMTDKEQPFDPMCFLQGMWGKMGFPLPGMVVPTLDTQDLEKRIKDLLAVENWLQINLNMLQMTRQGLEVQLATLSAVKSMREQAMQHAEEVLNCGQDSFTPKRQESAGAEQAAEKDTANPFMQNNPFMRNIAPGENPFATAAGMWPWNLMAPDAETAGKDSVKDTEKTEPAAVAKTTAARGTATGETAARKTPSAGAKAAGGKAATGKSRKTPAKKSEG